MWWRAVYERDDYTCQNCGARGGLHGTAELHANHIVNAASGGSHEPNNLVEEPEDEFITIVNEGEEVDLNGFVLRDGPGGVVDAGTVSAFMFPSHTFSAGEFVTVYTDDNPDADFSWGIGRQIWNQEGDTVIVDDPDGNTVMEETYESQVSTIEFVFNQVRALFA